MKRLYSCTDIEVPNVEVPYIIKEEKPSFVRAYKSQHLSAKKLMENIYWWLISKGKYSVWCAYDMGTVIHTSYVIPKCFKFPFLNDSDYEVGPCNTDKQYRGKGIYPAVLTKIIQSSETYYMIIDDMNIPSIRGASKAGFKALPGKIRTNCLKRYIYLREG